MGERIKIETKQVCDFCGKSEDDVAILVAGPKGVDICDECIATCAAMVLERRAIKKEAGK